MCKLYNESIRDINNAPEETSSASISPSNLEDKLNDKFNSRIQIMLSNSRKVIAPVGITAIDESLFAHLKDL